MIEKAVQQIMLGTVCKTEAQTKETLRCIKQAGYDGIELNGFMIRPTPFIVRMLTKFAGMPVGKGGNYHWKELLEEAGLHAVALHEDLGSIQKDPDAVIREANEFQTKHIVITGMYRFDYSDKAAVCKLASDLNYAAAELKKSGIQLSYHNHNCEFRKVEPGLTAYELLIRETDPDLVGFEFDSYWPNEAGVSAPDVMKRLGTRMKLFHINDRGTRISGPSMTPILTSDSMELGDGNMDLDALLAQAKAVGVDAVILETHKNWVDKSPIKSLERSAEYLKRCSL